MIKNKLKRLFLYLFLNGGSKSKNKLLVGLKRAFSFKELFEEYINELSVKYYNGKHPKHFLWLDHYKFIIENIKPGERVLDVGCGVSLSYNLELAKDQISIDAVDVNPVLIQKCKKENTLENINFYVLDITKELPKKKYDVVILSHVLEHLTAPEDLLRKLQGITKKIIIRLPRYDDHWMYLVKKDLGMFYFKERDHKQEYIIKTAKELIQSTGWKIIMSLNDIDIKIIAVTNNN